MRLRLALPALLLISLDLPAQIAASRDSVISVSATRNARILPDRAWIYIVMEGTAETAVDAVARVETKYKAVTDALKGFGARVESDRPFPYNVGPTPAPNGYSGVATPPTNLARSVIRVRLTRPDQAAEVMAAALTAGAVNTSGLSFESTSADSVRRASFADAIASAHADATAIAIALGGRLGALVDVSSTGSSPFGFQQQPYLNLDNRYSGQQTLAPELTANTVVTVRYRLMR